MQTIIQFQFASHGIKLPRQLVEASCREDALREAARRQNIRIDETGEGMRFFLLTPGGEELEVIRAL